MADVDGWSEYRRLILAELERLSGLIGGLNTRIDSLRADEISGLRDRCTRLEVELRLKAGVWGAICGAIPALLAAAAMYYSK